MTHLQGPHRPMPSLLEQAAQLHVEFLNRGLELLVTWQGAVAGGNPTLIRVWDEYSDTLVANSYEEAVAFLEAFDAGEAVLS